MISKQCLCEFALHKCSLDVCTSAMRRRCLCLCVCGLCVCDAERHLLNICNGLRKHYVCRQKIEISFYELQSDWMFLVFYVIIILMHQQLFKLNRPIQLYFLYWCLDSIELNMKTLEFGNMGRFEQKCTKLVARIRCVDIGKCVVLRCMCDAWCVVHEFKWAE